MLPHVGLPELILVVTLLALLAPLVLAFYGFRKLLRWLRD